MVGIAFFLCGAASAQAVTRYAAPGGTALDGVCTTPAAAHCNIKTAAAGPDVVGADTAIILPGNYSDSAGDLGNTNLVQAVAGNVEGQAGQPRPVITVNVAGFGAFFLGPGTTLSDVEIDTGSSPPTGTENFFNDGGVVDNVIAHSSAAFSIACGHQAGTIRDTACLSSGNNSTAIGTNEDGAAGSILPLRNVTAVATGTNSFGASYRMAGGNGTNWTIDALDLIAKGTSKDVAAAALSGTSMTCPHAVTFTLNNSDYATTQVTQTGGCTPNGNASVTAAGSGSNQTGAPALAADGIHELPSSTATIDHGVVDPSSGQFDIDGQQRTIGAAADIGADELANPSSTTVSCSPASLALGSGSSNCTTTVSDTKGSGVVTPTGTVALGSSGPGTFASGSCALSAISSGVARCSTTYTPNAIGTGSHSITAAYAGDTAHDSSQGTTSVGVTASVVGGGGGGGPAAAGSGPTGQRAAALTKCRKRHKQNHNKKKFKKCKKKANLLPV